MAWRMPAETAPHGRTWMAFPRTGLTLGDDAASAEEAYAAWTAVANAVAEFERVTMVVDPSERDRAARMLGSGIEQLEAPLDEFWMRDVGPTFVLDDERPGVLGAVDWIFLAEAYPGHPVVTVDARPILARGGGIHCITQQQPRLSGAQINGGAA